jgi:putative membrane protein
MLNILIPILIGCSFGIITGLFPGIHINLISVIVIGLSATLFKLASPLSISIFIISMAITHTFLDTIPAVYLGAPEEDTALSILPGHKLLLKGKGHEAIMLTLIGSLFSLIMIILLSPLITISIGKIYPFIKKYMVLILISTSSFLILKERKSRMWALIIFLLSGILGIATLNLPNLKSPLLPLLSGLFGTSMLTISIIKKSKIPPQQITMPNTNKKTITKSLSASFIAGTITSFLPGLGPAQAAIIGSQLIRNIKDTGFLILIGSLNTINMVLSFIALYTIDKARNGAVIAISKLIQDFSLNHLVLFLAVSLIVAGIATFLTINLSKIFSKIMSKINYTKLCISIIFLIIILVTIISGPLGLLILFTSTALGIVPAELGIGRNHLMGVLLLPVIFYFTL